jgi:tryptophan 2,3-dioxygenase
MTDLIGRLGHVTPETFPYDDVIAELRQLGKHFAAKDLLAALDAVRRQLRAGRDTYPAIPADMELAAFLDNALDKWDEKHEYPSYIGLTLLPMPGGHDPAVAARICDRLQLLLITDTLRFELAAETGQTALLPQMRPEPPVVTKRCRLGLRVVAAQLGALGLTPADINGNPRRAARQACQAVESGITPAERRTLSLSMLPVATIHDEYMFIRILQCFEVTFALLVVQLRAVIVTLHGLAGLPSPQGAAELVLAAEVALHEAAPLFSLLATMQVDAFRSFRQFTEGASAIQSRSYKIMEAQCRRPDPERLDSPAYRNVPEVRAMVLSGLPELQAAVSAARAAGVLSPTELQKLSTAMDTFAAVLSQWRTTHYRLAVRMLGTAPGTGYTEGTPYLKSVLDIPVFTTSAGPG